MNLRFVNLGNYVCRTAGESVCATMILLHHNSQSRLGMPMFIKKTEQSN